MATMQDVAERAGVAKSTVSRVLSGKATISEATRQRVLAAIDELGFRVNVLAQALAGNASNVIGLVISNFAGPYFGRLLKEIAAQAALAGKQLMVTDGHDDPAREQEAVALLADRRCDAIILYSRSMPEPDLAHLLASSSVPLVVINRQVAGFAERCVIQDQQQAVREAMGHLLALGHRQIACISGPLQTQTARERLAAYRQSLSEAGIAPAEALIAEGDNLVAGGYQACRELLARQHPFSALFAGNDDMALGALRALQEAGKRVPQDVSLLGFDDAPASAYLVPSLSTVHMPVEAMAERAITVALALAAGQQVESQCYFSGELKLRESLAPFVANPLSY